MKTNQVVSSLLTMSSLALASGQPDNAEPAVAKRDSTCFPKTLAVIAGSNTMNYGLLNVTAAIYAAFNLCDSNSCTGSNTLLSLQGDGYSDWDVQVSAQGEYTSPATRDMLLQGLIGLSLVGVTTSTENGNTVFTGPSSFNVQLQCNGVTDSIQINVSAGPPGAGDCPSWVGIATDFVWDFLSAIPGFPLGGILAGAASASCSS